ncbi:MAG: VWA domain-containing protein [Bacteroidetes bacterium]|nr:VWA domain-containing protein [Bacteroidota bacterium]
MDWTIGNYWGLALIPLLLVMLFLMLNFIKWKNKKREIFAESRFQDLLFQPTHKFSKAIPILYTIGLLFLALSIADFMKGSVTVKSKQNMNNIMFLLDVSNSMNAEDVEPNRMTLSKNIILNSLQNLKNDRVGIVVFAGEAASIMPLTTDFSAADNYVDAINTGMVKRQGTDFLVAMQEVVKKFKNIPKGSRHVVMISDGEDNENNVNDAIKLAKSEGISVITIGVGTQEGAPIPTYLMGQLMGYKTDINNGETIISKLQPDDLKDIANKTGGEYIEGNNLENSVGKLQSVLGKLTSDTTTWINTDQAERYYQYPLLVSLVCFFIIFIFNPKKDFNL